MTTIALAEETAFKQRISKLPEVAIYGIIFTFTEYIWQMNHDRRRGHISDKDWPFIEKDIQKIQDRHDYVLMTQLGRFGIETVQEGRAWFKWWDNFVQKVLSEDEWQILNTKLLNHEPVSDYRPEGEWQ